MKKSIKALALVTAVLLAFTVSPIQSQDPEPIKPKPDYDQGKMVKDYWGTDVFVCPHTEGTVNCVS
ncbi:hypothetical protein [Marivirga sp.]|uniref:hypothetical protein n=1 Tax=Marivirga sp. TaxID=2018662 RepID=UPI002D7FC3E6|nr:hypothetical protein [Marivirga sp.]